MAQPEKILLQKKAWRQHATLANGVKCGEEAAFPVGLRDAGSRGMIIGWGTYLSLSGRIMEGQWPPQGGVDSDKIFRVRDKSLGWETRDVSDQLSNRRILGLMTNSAMPDLVRVVLDAGDDKDQPGQRECEQTLLGTNDLDDRLIELLKWGGMLPEDYVPPEGPPEGPVL